MPKRKIYAIFLSFDDRIDADLEFEKDRGKRPRLARFAITYSARISEIWREVVRYDNFHGRAHRQRFWRSGEPEDLSDSERMGTEQLLEACRKDLRRNWRRYRHLMERASRKE